MGLIQLVLTGISMRTLTPTNFSRHFVDVGLFFGAGCLQVVSAFFLLKGRAWALVPFALACGLFAFDGLARGRLLLATGGFGPLVLLVLSAMPASSTPPPPERRDTSETSAKRSEDIY